MKNLPIEKDYLLKEAAKIQNAEKAIDDYRANFRKLIEDQAEVIKSNLNLFD